MLTHKVFPSAGRTCKARRSNVSRVSAASTLPDGCAAPQVGEESVWYANYSGAQISGTDVEVSCQATNQAQILPLSVTRTFSRDDSGAITMIAIPRVDPLTAVASEPVAGGGASLWVSLSAALGSAAGAQRYLGLGIARQSLLRGLGRLVLMWHLSLQDYCLTT